LEVNVEISVAPVIVDAVGRNLWKTCRQVCLPVFRLRLPQLVYLHIQSGLCLLVFQVATDASSMNSEVGANSGSRRRRYSGWDVASCDREPQNAAGLESREGLQHCSRSLSGFDSKSHAMQLFEHEPFDLPPVQVAGLGSVLRDGEVDLALSVVGADMVPVDEVNE
jgi:hypothetical protein